MLLLRTSRGVDPGIPLLRSLGSNAHVWIPGANGVSVASLPSNNYLLSDGSTGYSTVDGVVGLDLDGMGSLGSELVTNGTFDSDTAWTKAASWSIAGGVAANDGTNGGGVASLNQAGVVAAGRTYIITFDLTRTSGSINLYLNASQLVFAGLNASGSKQYVITSTVTGSLYFEATASAVVSLDNISVKEYTGTHLTQPTTANKPLVRRGMLNLMFQSQDFSNAAWTAGKSAGATVGALTTGPDGTLSARQITYAGGADYLNQGIASYPAVTGSSVTIALVVKSAVQLLVVGGGTAAGTDVFTSASTGGGWYLQAVTRTFTTTTSAFPFQCLPASMIAGAGTYDYYRGGLFRGSFTAAQILAEGGIPTTTATAASNPSAGKYWWGFDGSNDSLLSRNLGITNACTIVIAGRVNSLGATQMLFAEDNSGANLFVTSSGVLGLSKAGVANLVLSSAGAIVAGVPFVVTARLSGGTAVLRKNGVQIATAGSVPSFVATTGARIGIEFDGVSSPLNGAIGWVVPLPVALSDADCLTVERLVSSQFPNGPVF